MKELVEVIAKALVEHPDEVAVRERTEGKVIKVDLYVAPADGLPRQSGLLSRRLRPVKTWQLM